MFHDLPNEIICYIFNFLNAKDVNFCQIASKIFNVLSENEYNTHIMKLWEETYFFFNCDLGKINTPQKIAKILYHLYKNNYRCSLLENNTWYELQNDKWVKVDTHSLYKKIFSMLISKFSKIYTYNRINEEKSEKFIIVDSQSEIIRIVRCLNTKHYRDEVMNKLKNFVGCNEILITI